MDLSRRQFTTITLASGASLLVPATALAAVQRKSYRIEINQVRVERQREGSGDRPYLVMMPFQTRFNTPRTTSVRLVESEPHDWVSKRQYNRGLGGRDHMRRGDRLNLPWWMGNAEFRRVEVRDDVLREGMPWLFGAVIVSLDNNNTPPHVVRNLLKQVRARLEGLLRTEVERGRLLRGVALNRDAMIRRIRERVPGLAGDLVKNLDANIFDWTFGSTFNPDKITGIQVYLWPGMTGVAAGSTSGTQRLAGDTLHWRAEWGTPPNTIQPLNFTARGSNAEYRYSGVLRELRPDSRGVSHADILLKTGHDDLRSGSQLTVTLHGARGQRAVFPNINRSRSLPQHSDAQFTQRLPAGWRASDLHRVDLRFTGSGDNWDFEGIGVRLRGSVTQVALIDTDDIRIASGRTRSYDIRR